jgi:hypothetical protein
MVAAGNNTRAVQRTQRAIQTDWAQHHTTTDAYNSLHFDTPGGGSPLNHAVDELADERLTVAIPGKALQKYRGGKMGTHCPPSMKEMRFLEKPPEGEFSWKGHKNLDTLPKLLQQVVKLWTMSSVQMTPSAPSSWDNGFRSGIAL